MSTFFKFLSFALVKKVLIIKFISIEKSGILIWTCQKHAWLMNEKSKLQMLANSEQSYTILEFS